MKKASFTLLILCITTALLAQTGKVYENMSMESKILKMDRKYAIYLPPDYETSQRSYPVLYLLHGAGDDQKDAVRWYIDCGDDDFLYEGNSLVHIAMRKKEIPHEFRIRDGGHNWTYWRTALPKVMEFISVPFHQ